MRKSAEHLPDEIHITWHIDDIKSRDATLTDEECREILSTLERKHDAGIGINWDVIDAAIDWYKWENNEEVS